MSRILKIKNFRNIGLEKEETVILNYSLEKGKMGNVVYLIGTNNSGKSNILDALSLFYNNNLSASRDKTNLYKYSDKDLKPEISLEIIHKEGKCTSNISSTIGLNNEKLYVTNIHKEYEFTENQLDNVIIKIETICAEYDEFSTDLDDVKNSEKFELKIIKFISFLKKLENHSNRYYYSSNSGIFNEIKELNDKDSKALLKFYEINKNNSQEDIANNYMKSKLGYPFDISIIKYNDTNISPNEFKTSYNYLRDSIFFHFVI